MGVWASEVGIQQTNKNIQTVQGSEDDYINYTVVAGDNVFSLARKHKTTVEEIYRLNPEAKNGIKAGQVLRIPKSKTQANISETTQSTSSYIEYTVKKKETLHGISRANEVSIETIYSLNPQVKKDGLKEGMVLKIPRKKISSTERSITPVKAVNNKPEQNFIEHEVKKKETLHGLSKTYNVSIESLIAYNPGLKDKGLKAGSKIRIPSSAASLENISQSINGIIQTPRFIKTSDPIRIGILFPFLDNKAAVQKEKLVEYYEGFLLAVKKMKEAGVNAEIYTFDTGSEKDTKRLKNILETSEANNLHLVIGGSSQAQIDMLIDFSQKTGIRYVVPFGVKKDILDNSPNVFQLTTSHTALYDEIIKAFISKFRSNNIVFVTEQGSNTNRNDFVSALKKALTQENISFRDLRMGEKVVEEMKSAIDKTRNNVLIPTSSSETTLRKITGVLDLVPNESVTLFGYPEWQTYLGQTSQLHKFNTYIYSSFYLYESDSAVKNMMEEYKNWYNKTVALSFPKFAFLGYDAGLFFISNLNSHRNQFDKEISHISSPTLQTSIHFVKEKEGAGYKNTGFYFINFKKDGSIDKIEYK